MGGGSCLRSKPQFRTNFRKDCFGRSTRRLMLACAVGSIHDRKAAVGFGKGSGQAPWLEALGAAFFGDGFAFAVVKLPGNGAAFVPRGTFGPRQKDFAT